MVITALVATYVLAALMHNVTSILIVTPIIIQLCAKYGLPSRWILSAALVASNLGGFSTRWGDTPNIVEARTWDLTSKDFTYEVMPANLLVLVVLTFVAIRLTRRTADYDPIKTALAAAAYGREATDIRIDARLFSVGVGALFAFISLQALWPELQIAAGCLVILVAVASERRPDRLGTLKSLGYDVYLVFASIFVLAGCVEQSWLGSALEQLLKNSAAAPWAIAITGYLGTTFTEAASWATAAASRIHPLDSSHAAAWALGGGICAGSSSIVTAASAGIILCEQSRSAKQPHHLVTFRSYLPFGLSFSLFMLVFYSAYFTLLRY
jgi:Na+/H+ antiporter NhaD/arsenite permease-like protein